MTKVQEGGIGNIHEGSRGPGVTSGQGGRGALFRIQNKQAKQTCCTVLTYEFLYPVTTMIPSLVFFRIMEMAKNQVTWHIKCCP